MVGKWHLGHCDTRYTPPHRGFHSFLGSYSGAVDHWTREGGLAGRKGYDLRNGSAVSCYGAGLHSAELYSRRAVEIIQESSGAGAAPYFLYVSLTMVHAPFQV
jgi:arylsulfatase A-like enzyme